MRVEMDDVVFVAETSLTIRGPRRRTTVPKEIVDRMGLSDGDHLRWILFKDGRVVVLRVAPAGARARGSKRGA